MRVRQNHHALTESWRMGSGRETDYERYDEPTQSLNQKSIGSLGVLSCDDKKG